MQFDRFDQSPEPFGEPGSPGKAPTRGPERVAIAADRLAPAGHATRQIVRLVLGHHEQQSHEHNRLRHDRSVQVAQLLVPRSRQDEEIDDRCTEQQ